MVELIDISIQDFFYMVDLPEILIKSLLTQVVLPEIHARLTNTVDL